MAAHAEVGHNAQHAIGHVLDAHHEAIEALRAPRSRANILAAATAPAPASRILEFGIGPSAAIAAYVSVLLNRNGRPAAPLASTGIAIVFGLASCDRGAAVGTLERLNDLREQVSGPR